MNNVNFETYDLQEIDDLCEKFNDSKYITNTGLIFSNIEKYKSSINFDIYLKHLAESLTVNCNDKLSKIKRIVYYVQTTFKHSFRPILDEDAISISNPLILLDLKMGHCGQVNKLLVDLLNALGFKAKLLKLNRHIAASVKFNNEWRFLDGDCLSHGQIIKNENNEIASVKDVLTNPILTMNTLTNIKNDVFLNKFSAPLTFQERKVFQGATFIEKNTRDRKFNTSNRYYGWNFRKYHTCKF
jgi:hypothetical protein